MNTTKAHNLKRTRTDKDILVSFVSVFCGFFYGSMWSELDSLIH